jgi:hypothetical protein
MKLLQGLGNIIMLGVLRENTSQVITMTDWESNLTFIATMLKDALQPSSIVLVFLRVRVSQIELIV